MTKTSRLTQERLKEVLDYDPEAGAFVWKVTMGSRALAGQHAGSIGKVDGYRHIRIDGASYKAARLAVLYMTGCFPPDTVDHRNLKRLDDSWGNLRLATESQQKMNRRVHKNNKSGFKGVSWHPRGEWVARIRADNKQTTIGYFDSPQEAAAAYDSAAKRLHGEFARTNGA